MDITESLAPKSDQLDAIELVASGPRTFTIAGVSKGNPEQPVNVELAEFPRVWRPSKGMRRVLARGWGVDASAWVGRRITLYCDESVTFGNERPGGTRIKAMSDLPGGKRLSVLTVVSRGKTTIFTVEPLDDGPSAADVAACTDPAVLRSWWPHVHLREAITARVAELTADPEADQ